MTRHILYFYDLLVLLYSFMILIFSGLHVVIDTVYSTFSVFLFDLEKLLLLIALQFIYLITLLFHDYDYQ